MHSLCQLRHRIVVVVCGSDIELEIKVSKTTTFSREGAADARGTRILGWHDLSRSPFHDKPWGYIVFITEVPPWNTTISESQLATSPMV